MIISADYNEPIIMDNSLAENILNKFSIFSLSSAGLLAPLSKTAFTLGRN
jgi:hypothetical protein